MPNPYADVAKALLQKVDEADAQRQAEIQIEEALKASAEQKYRHAVERFHALEKIIALEIEKANNELGRKSIKLLHSISPMQRHNAGAITIGLSVNDKLSGSFRVVGNSELRVFIHDIPGVNFPGLSLENLEEIPLEAALVAFLKSAAEREKS